ncbi:MAG: 3-isopropylmalate dehydratase large subunit [Methermicoccaceae archaeon]
MVGKTLSEKIFSRAVGREVSKGEFVLANIDLAMIHDITGPLAIEALRSIKGESAKVFDPSKVVIVFDHQVPADSLNAANNHIFLRQFAEEQGILNYDVFEGICHQVLPEKGHVEPGMLIIGADSHTCAYGSLGAFSTGVGSTDMGFGLALGKLWFKVPPTVRFEIEGHLPEKVVSKDVILHLIGDVGADFATYRACEFAGEMVRELNIPARMTMSNMAIEMGGKAGLIEADKTTERYLQERIEDLTLDGEWKSDEDAIFEHVLQYDISDLSPMVARPHSVDNVVSVSEITGTHVDQVFIGSCTNGRYEDLAQAAELLEGEHIAKGVRLIVIPASRTEYMKALKAGIVEKLMEAGAIVEYACCGPCMGGSFGLLGDGEIGFATSNRNFKGREGSSASSVYLGSPYTAAATALYGEITDPREV